MPCRKFIGIIFACTLTVCCAGVPASAQKQIEWLPVTPEELALKEVPGVTGAHAIVLYRELNSDDPGRFQQFYTRIKILSEAGRKYANVEVSYVKQAYNVDDIEARTIRPDGTIAEFHGQIFDKTVVKAGGLKIQAKSFSLPDVQVGTILEYRYTIHWVFFGWRKQWLIQDELFIRHAKFSFRPYVTGGLKWMSYYLPAGRKAVAGPDRIIRLEVENIAALEKEEFMPPESEVQMRVEFFYVYSPLEKPDAYWQRIGKQESAALEKYMDKSDAMKAAVSNLISAADSPEGKLRKIYARVQSLRNLSFERSKTDKEEKKENLKPNNHVEDVWKHGYGSAYQLNLLFAALARAAGFSADVVLLSARSDYFFKSDMPDARQLNTDAVVVKLDDKDLYLDPGMQFCPFGMLPWASTGVEGLRLTKDASSFIRTPDPKSADARVERRAALKLREDGSLSGRVTVSFSGYEALSRRMSARQDDEATRKKDLEDLLKRWLPSSATVKLENVTGWEGTQEPLRAEFTIEVPSYASMTGRRVLFAPSVFQTQRKNPFQFAQRKHPIYFTYPWQELDELTVELPAGFRVETELKPREHEPSYAKFHLNFAMKDGKLEVRRSLEMNAFYLDTNFYNSLKVFYGNVSTGDEQQVVLRAAENAVSQ